MTTPNPGPPPGWYPNPDRNGQQRWWDGQQWGPSAPIPQALPIGAPAHPASANTSKGLAIASMITGIVALALCWVFVLGLILGITAVGLGIGGLKQARGMALVGIITGGASAAIFFIVAILGSLAS